MLERFIARLPAVLLLVVILLAVHVAVFEAEDDARLLSVAPAAVLLLAYLGSGRRRRGR